VKDREGVPLSVQVDRTLRAWLEEKGVTMKQPSKASSGNRGLKPRNKPVKVAVYARVSTHDQTAENQLIELRAHRTLPPMSVSDRATVITRVIQAVSIGSRPYLSSGTNTCAKAQPGNLRSVTVTAIDRLIAQRA
jgi:hypothetical protein